MKLKKDYAFSSKILDEMLRINDNFDIIKREIKTGDRQAAMYMVDGFAKDDILEKILEFVMSLSAEDFEKLPTAITYAEKFIPYTEVELSNEAEDITTKVLSGTICYIVDGYETAILIDARTYPARDVSEPDDDRVLRGSHEGFVETLVFNTALIRRKIRDPNLTMEIHSVGKKSKTDIVFCYLENMADKTLLQKLRDKIKNVDIRALTMAQQSLAEALINNRWYNPFPKIRYTERPDSASASVLEGKILIIVDGTPSVMILPTAIFDFLQEADDFYFPPISGTYLRITRILIFFSTLFLTPVWYLLIKNPSLIPSWLDFIKPEGEIIVPIIAQLLLIELAIDALKIASLNTPSVLSNSFSIIGALILGEFAVNAGWVASEVILYMAFVAIGSYAQPSFELGYAFKFMRILILILTAIFNLWGFVIGVILTLIFIATNKTFGGKSYLYPLIPFNANDMLNVFVRRKLRVAKRNKK